MTKKSSKQKRDKKRKEALKQKKAKARTLPKLLRNEAFLEILSTRHRLVGCLINEGWQEESMANIFVIRDGPAGLVFANFLVDLLDRGLTDAWGSFDASHSEIEMIKAEASRGGFSLVPCNQDLAEKIVHGGIAWARKWGNKLPREYRIWIRLLEPPRSSEIDLDLFGVDGEPLYALDDGDQDGFYERILSRELEVTEEGFSRDTLIRIGDIKRALVHFAKSLDFEDEMNLACEMRLGEPKPPDSGEKWIGFLDWFILEYELEEGGTIAGLFVKYYEDVLSEDVRELILGWQEVIEGLFEIKDVSGDALDVKNLINEREYRVFSTALLDDHGLGPGDFIYGRIVPAKSFHLFSGNVRAFEGDGRRSEVVRAEVYRKAIKIQGENPRLAFKDNPEKLEKSREVVREYHEAFVRRFGADEVLGAGQSISGQYREFFGHFVRETSKLKEGNGPAPSLPEFELPDKILASDEVGMLCDPVEGIFFLIDYGRFVDVFRSPDLHLGKEETEDLVMGYLESDSISDVPFRRMAERFAENFKRVVEYYRDREGFDSTDIKDLMREFKPWTSEKLPGIVVVLDAEMARLARKSEREPSTSLNRIKKWFKK